jgi:hypothetical protein
MSIDGWTEYGRQMEVAEKAGSEREKEEKRKTRERSPPRLHECCSNLLVCSSPSTGSAVVVN